MRFHSVNGWHIGLQTLKIPPMNGCDGSMRWGGFGYENHEKVKSCHRFNCDRANITGCYYTTIVLIDRISQTLR